MLLHARPQLFEFEHQASENLTYIPMCVRFNLDSRGLKLTLTQWQGLPYDERVRLCRHPLADDASGSDGPDGFAAALSAQVEAAGGGVLERVTQAADESWRELDAVPPTLLKQCELQAMAVPGLALWRGLSAFQRYVLLKLSRRGTVNHDFPAAWKEFTS